MGELEIEKDILQQFEEEDTPLEIDNLSDEDVTLSIGIEERSHADENKKRFVGFLESLLPDRKKQKKMEL